MYGRRPREAGKYLKHFALLSLLVSPRGFVPGAVQYYFRIPAPSEVAVLAAVYINIRFLELPFRWNSAIGSFDRGGERQGTHVAGLDFGGGKRRCKLRLDIRRLAYQPWGLLGLPGVRSWLSLFS